MRWQQGTDQTRDDIYGTSQEASYRYTHHRAKSAQPIQGGRRNLRATEKLVPYHAL